MLLDSKQDYIFETLRLKVRNLIKDDFSPFHDMQSDYQVMQYTTMRALNIVENRKSLDNVISAYSKKHNDFWVWAVLDEKDDFIGTCAIVKDAEENDEIGFRLLRKYWNKGYGTELVHGLIKFVESQPQIDNLIAYTDRRNIASQNILNKTGFVNLGIKYDEENDTEDYMYSINTK